MLNFGDMSISVFFIYRGDLIDARLMPSFIMDKGRSVRATRRDEALLSWSAS